MPPKEEGNFRNRNDRQHSFVFSPRAKSDSKKTRKKGRKARMCFPTKFITSWVQFLLFEKKNTGQSSSKRFCPDCAKTRLKDFPYCVFPFVAAGWTLFLLKNPLPRFHGLCFCFISASTVSENYPAIFSAFQRAFCIIIYRVDFGSPIVLLHQRSVVGVYKRHLREISQLYEIHNYFIFPPFRTSCHIPPFLLPLLRLSS